MSMEYAQPCQEEASHGTATQPEGKMTKEVPEVLFVCVHNAGRSQMAAGLLDQLS